MLNQRDYAADSEFQKLCARRRDVDLTLAALELARDADAGLRFDETLEWIDARGRELSGPVARAKNEIDILHELAATLSETHGIFGDAGAYERAESSYLPRVIETGRGIPISLSVLYMAVAARTGIELSGAAAPAHFLTRYESLEGPLFVDAFSYGRILRHDDCVQWLRDLTQATRQQVQRALRPADPRTIIIRMLNNLKAVHARHEDWPAAWKVQHRLMTLEPASYVQRRDLALLSVRAERPADAVDGLRACLKSCPEGERETLEEQLDQARRQLARWN